MKLDDLDFLGPSAVNAIDDQAGSKTNTHTTEPMHHPSHAYLAIVIRGYLAENSDSCADDTDGDLNIY